MAPSTHMTGDSLGARVARYKNTAEHNDALFIEFTNLTDTVPVLRRHRDWVEDNRLGLGERAFHFLWWLLLKDAAERFERLRALEIGVHNGQAISLWAVASRQLGVDMEITAISPFEGNDRPMPKWFRSIRKRIDSKYAAQKAVGNLHLCTDFIGNNRRIFSEFGLDFDDVRAIKGLSQDEDIIRRMEKETFEIIYIDGDHSHEAVCSDIANYGPLVREDGYLVLDDAGAFLPGDACWKGIESVSRAADTVHDLGFENVLNVGHARIFRKSAAPS